MAVPVSPEDTYHEISATVDEIVCLYVPSFFEAVGQFYRNFNQTEDEEVIELMAKANKRKD